MSMDLNYAAGWRPEEGDTIVGTVTDIAAASSNYGGRYPVVTVQPDEGEPVAIHCFHAALKARVIELRPEVGERIGVKYLGKREHKTDRTLTVADYIVKIEGRGAANVWAQVGEDPAPAPASDVPVDASDFKSEPVQDDDIPF